MSYSLIVDLPSKCTAEYTYVLSVIFYHFLGLEFRCRTVSGPDDTIRVRLAQAPDAGVIELPDFFIKAYEEKGPSSSLLPKAPLPIWRAKKELSEVNLVRPDLPVIFGSPLSDGTWFELQGNKARLGLDVLGSAFFMLTRFEEAVLPDRDKHGRFPGNASLAFREGFLDRPIVDEYVEILWAIMKRLWPGIRRKQRSYRVFLSHDVDVPFVAAGRAWPTVIRRAVGDLVKRTDVGLAARTLASRLFQKPELDPANTFSFILDTSERFGIKSTFFFKAGVTNLKYDVFYDIGSPWIRNLFREIHARDHEIGLHPSYESYRNKDVVKKELERLAEAVSGAGVRQDQWGARQHYLRWENPTTWQIYADVGLDYDATLGYADHVGFRAGTCQEFPVFNLITRRDLRLKERPLVIMEVTLLEYMRLNSRDALQWVNRLSDLCRWHSGIFSLLWHNSVLDVVRYRKLYLEVLNAIH